MWGLPAKIKTRLARIDRQRSWRPGTLGGAEPVTLNPSPRKVGAWDSEVGVRPWAGRAIAERG